MIKENYQDTDRGLHITNHMVAEHLLEASNILRVKGANQYRIRAYRSAATTIEKLDKDIEEILANEEVNGLIKLPHIGKSIAYAIYELVATGKWKFLESLRDSMKAPVVFMLIPGVGPKLARMFYEDLGLNSLEELEMAANAGKISAIKGIGDRRQRMIMETLRSILHDSTRMNSAEKNGPGVDLLLKIDKMYRKKAQLGQLKKIAPKRYNPEGTSWLPILHHKDKQWDYRVMYSNTERAHRLHKEHDWVIIHAYDKAHHEYSRTIVTETSGKLKNKRVVRGYEEGCMEYYNVRN